jgi:hypothetical protein
MDENVARMFLEKKVKLAYSGPDRYVETEGIVILVLNKCLVLKSIDDSLLAIHYNKIRKIEG